MRRIEWGAFARLHRRLRAPGEFFALRFRVELPEFVSLLMRQFVHSVSLPSSHRSPTFTATIVFCAAVSLDRGECLGLGASQIMERAALAQNLW